jgi:hypothetical protein
MKNRTVFIGITAMLSIYIFLFLPGCSTTDEPEDFQKYELNVIVGEGVSGTPVQGTYPYNEGDTVNYSYELMDNYKNLTVTLDNDEVEASGTVTITEVHNLKALADPIFDVTGSWTLSEEYDDGSLFDVTAVFSGSLGSGIVTDSDGGEGIYAVDEYNQVEFNLNFDNITYEYEGRLDGANSMAGSCKKASGSGTSYGYWTATRGEVTSSIKATPASGKKVSKGKRKN